MTATTTCTVRTATGTCGRPAVYTERSRWADETFGECAACAAVPGSMYATRHMRGTPAGGHRVGDPVVVHRYGKAYDAVVTRVGAKGAAYATFTYGNGAERTVRVGDRGE